MRLALGRLTLLASLGMARAFVRYGIGRAARQLPLAPWAAPPAGLPSRGARCPSVPFAGLSTSELSEKLKRARGVDERYELLVRELYEVNMWNPVKLGLDNVRALHGLVGAPSSRYHVVHIAGTNGKGSVAYKIADTLRRSGKRVGLFVSPHISTFRERMVVDGAPIPMERVVELLPDLLATCEEHGVPATFFEITTVLAMQYFADAGCEYVVLETGLGGRLDATNVVERPALTAITSIGLEHTRVLGDTIEAIAAEKAGIIKPGVPLVAGPKAPHTILRRHAADKASAYVAAAAPASEDDVDEENASIAAACLRELAALHAGLRVPEAALREGLRSRPPCRFEVLRVEGVEVVLDVAHNGPAMERLVRKLAAEGYGGRPLLVVCGFCRDKDVDDCLRSLATLENAEAFVAQAPHPRALAWEKVAEAAERQGLALAGPPPGTDRAASVAEQTRRALEAAKGPRGPGAEEPAVLICGSVFLMSDARLELGVDEDADAKTISALQGSHLRAAQDNMAATDAK